MAEVPPTRMNLGVFKGKQVNYINVSAVFSSVFTELQNCMYTDHLLFEFKTYEIPILNDIQVAAKKGYDLLKSKADALKVRFRAICKVCNV